MAIWQPPEEAAPPAPEIERVEREYIVVLKKDVDYDAFWEQIENASDDDGFVPTRRVDIINERPGSLRSCHYSLTDEEAEKLKNDPRVYGVEIPPDQRDDIEIGFHAIQEGTWRKTSSIASADQNWGLLRGAVSEDPWKQQTSVVSSYPYTLTGKGVDVVIQDSGVTPDHSEWLDENGESRYRSIDWYVASKLWTPSTTGVPINLKDGPSVCITNKGSIMFQRQYAPFYSGEWLPAITGAALHMGSNFYNNLNVVYGGVENGGRSYRIRFEGTTGNPAGGTGGDLPYTWEVVFTDSNAIQVLMVRHDFTGYVDPVDDLYFGDQYGLTAGPLTGDPNIDKYITYNVKQSINRSELGVYALQGESPAPSSYVFVATDDNASTWTAYTNNNDPNNNYSLQLDGDDWVLSNTLATEGGSSGLSVIAEGIGEPTSPASIERWTRRTIRFNLPFDFLITGNDTSPQNVQHDRDINGHGSHCAGTVAGRTLGWAKDAHIYHLKVNGLESYYPGDSTGISISDCFDVIKLWHRNKPIDPKTGFKRPTVVNMSWGYSGSRTASTLASGTYRGTPWTSSDAGFTSSIAQWQSAGIIPAIGQSRRINARVASVDADLEELIDEGVHVCIAAGNSYYYIAAEGDQDWDNAANFGSGNEYYHRGSSPYSTNAFMVGNIDIDYQGGLENKAESSCCGPGVDIYAPGTQIISVASKDLSGSNEIVNLGTFPVPTFFGSNYNLMKISGTSMASPNVAGMIATILEANPGMTPAQMKTFLHNNATQDLLYNGATDDWDDQDSIQGGPNRIFKTPFTSSTSIRTSNITIRKADV